VPSVRDWLTRKQKETRRGRAELMMADRAAVWNARPENRQLPSLTQWSQIKRLTWKRNWTPPQRKMMRNASRYHTLRGLALALVLALIGFGTYDVHGRIQARALRDRLLDASTADVPGVVRDMGPYRRWIDPLLQSAYADAQNKHDARKQLHASLGLLPVQPGQRDYLYQRLLDAEPHEVPVIRDALDSHKDELTDKLWAVVEKPAQGKESQRLRAASALAKYDPESQRWDKAGALVVNDLVLENPVFLGQWSEAFRPVKNRLLSQLSDIFRNHQPERTAERSLATNLLADYAADQPEVLADLVMDADEKQFAVFFPKLKDRGEQGLPALSREIDHKLPPAAKDEAKETLAKRQANAAVALLKMNQPEKVWPLLKHNSDPRVRSHLIHRLSPLRADAKAIVNRLEREPDLTSRRALILSLGEFSEKDFSQNERKILLPKLQEIYQTADDPGLHAVSESLLRTWKQEKWLKQMNDEWKTDKEQRAKRLDGIKQMLAKEKGKTPRQWYVNSVGQTMVIIPGPVEFQMGSPKSEAGRADDEALHAKRINRTFAIAAKTVTVAEYREFNEGYILEQSAPEPDCPVVSTSWFQAAAYCNWLSDREGFDRCYEEDGNGNVTALKKGYLGLNGYRLPTESEWEYACRAGAATHRYYGDAVELLAKYGWYVDVSSNRSWPVGSLKPNDYGLFDTHGNVWNWCQERPLEYPSGDAVTVDTEDILTIDREGGRVLRGGSFNNRPSDVRSADRNDIVPTSRSYNVGVRPARTFTP
jgi:formylglycine-generating enzyme required for sulfatase activity